MPVPNRTKAQYPQGAIDVTTDTLRIALFDDTTAYTVDIDNHDFVSDVLDGGTTATEMSGTGYSRQTLSTVTVTIDDTDDEAEIDCDDVTFTGLDAGTIQGYIIYQQIGGDDTTPGDDPILQIVDDRNNADLPLTTNGSDVTLTIDAEGFLNLA